jgi:hypothetical protein
MPEPCKTHELFAAVSSLSEIVVGSSSVQTGSKIERSDSPAIAPSG